MYQVRHLKMKPSYPVCGLMKLVIKIIIVSSLLFKALSKLYLILWGKQIRLSLSYRIGNGDTAMNRCILKGSLSALLRVQLETPCD